MVITILAEPRSGGTNLANWFFFNKNFTTLFIPTDQKSEWYQNEQHPKDYQYTTEHLLIKEDYYHYKDYTEIIKISDKVILLYRENEHDQILSWTNAKKTNNWDGQWINEHIEDENERIFFKKLKNSFKENFLSKNDHLKISYENLYFNDGIELIKKYIDLNGLNDISFPIGQKYRIDKKIKSLF
jgi:LPS sulfotransferase NodH